jgi:hypothetical protein
VGHFSNGTEGEGFVASYCSRCVNWRRDENDPDRGEGCAVWDAHLIAGNQFPEHARTDEERGAATATQMLLEILIRSDGARNECQMFVDNNAPDPRQLEFPR